MKLDLLTDKALAVLKDSANYDMIFDSDDFLLSNFFKEKGLEEYYYQTDIEIDDFTLLLSSKPKYDADNAITVHKAMKNLLPIQAREEKIWVYLCFTKCWDYMKLRWKIDDVNKRKGRISDRYFFSTNNSEISIGTKPYVRNGIARLWWGAHIAYDERLGNPYEYVKDVFRSQDLFAGLSERNFTKNKNVTISILKCVRKYNLLSDDDMNTLLIREILKAINYSTGLIVYDALDENAIYEEIDKIFIKVMNKNKK